MAECENQERCPNDAGNGRGEGYGSTDVGSWIIVSISNCSHGYDGAPHKILEIKEILIAFLGQAEHSGIDDNESNIED